MTSKDALAMTVLGPVPISELGITLPHEHVFLDLSCWWSHPVKAERAHLVHLPVSSIDRELLLSDPYHTRDNLILDDLDLAVEELNLFAAAGGRTIVDLTSRTIGPYPGKLKEVARRTGLNIIASTGHYVKRAHPRNVSTDTVDELANQMIKELTEGIDDSGVKAGIIGELGTSSPIAQEEEKVLQAAAIAHEETGAAINVHMTIFAREGHNVLNMLEKFGVDPAYVALSHLDELPDRNYHRTLAKRGCFIEFDCFGSECRFDEDDCREPTDQERLAALLDLLDQGFGDQLLLSQDIATKMQLHRYGGNGYDHVLRRILPQLEELGVDDQAKHKMMVSNPARLLAGNISKRRISIKDVTGAAV